MCIYINIHTHSVYIYTHTHSVYIYIHTHSVYICIHTYIVYMYIYICMCIHVYIYIYTQIHCISRLGDHLEHQRMRSLWFSLGIRGWDGTSRDTGLGHRFGYLEGLLIDFGPEGRSPGMCTCVHLSMSLRACFSASACRHV